MSDQQSLSKWCRLADDEMQPSEALGDAICAINRYEPIGSSGLARQNQVLDFIAAHPDALHRTCLPGHLTGSSWVVDDSGNRGLILYHSKIKRWVQPGGHADGDANLAAVALREATEETGISDLEVWPVPIDIDIHLFVNRKDAEPDHLHHDLRYLVRAPSGAVASRNHESEAIRWVGADDLRSAELDLDESTVRLALSAFATVNSLP